MNYMKAFEIVEDVAIPTGIAVALSDIQAILSMVLLIFNISWLVMKLIIKIVRYYKNDGKIDDDEKKDICDDIESIDKYINKNGGNK